MMTFLVPLRSKKVANDWNRCCDLLTRTLKSITSQTSDDYHVVVVCHELPEKLFEHSKIAYHTVDFDPPVYTGVNYLTEGDPGEDDKARKLLAALELESVQSSEYVMPVDADDLVSSGIAQFIGESKSRDIPGWYLKKGYLYLEGKNYLFLNNENFNVRCGTCIIIQPKLLPYLVDTGVRKHFKHARIRLNKDQELLPFPFAAAIYSMANGQNLFMNTNSVNKLKHRYDGLINKIIGLINKTRKYSIRFLFPGIRKEFGLYKMK